MNKILKYAGAAMAAALMLTGCGSGLENSSSFTSSMTGSASTNISTEIISSESESTINEVSGNDLGNNYYELAIGLDDLKVAGYSVLDGNKMQEVYSQVVSSGLPEFDNSSHYPQLVDGWVYESCLMYPGSLHIEYMDLNNRKNGRINWGNIIYTVDDFIWESFPFSQYTISYDLAYEGISSGNYPLLTSRVEPRTPIAEVIEIYGLGDLINKAQSTSEPYHFNSQYGETHIWLYEIDDTRYIYISSVDQNEGGMSVSMSFKNGLLTGMSITVKGEKTSFDYYKFNLANGYDYS